MCTQNCHELKQNYQHKMYSYIFWKKRLHDITRGSKIEFQFVSAYYNARNGKLLHMHTKNRIIRFKLL